MDIFNLFVGLCEARFAADSLIPKQVPSNWGVRNFNIADYVIWAFVFSSSMPSLNILAHCNGVTSVEIARKIEWVTDTLYQHARRDIRFLSYDEWDKDMEFVRGVYKDSDLANYFNKYCYIVDGTGIKQYTSTRTDISKLQNCYFKHEQQVRFQAVCTTLGRLVYISALHIGHMSDEAALDASTYRSEFAEFYKLTEDPGRHEGDRTGCGGTNAKHILIGDQGYPKIVAPACTDILCTRSAQDTDGWQKAKNRPAVIVVDGVSPVRTVIERIFGRMSLNSRFLRGPIFVSQEVLALKFVFIYGAVYNRGIDKGLDLFVDTSG